MQVTTALRKISALKKRIKVIQGGQGAGKTFAILILLINHASANKGKTIYIASSELTKMRITVIKDFISILKSFNIFEPERFLGGTLYTFKSGSTIKFIGLDKEDIGKGLRSDIIFLNEGNKVGFETYRELTSRAKQIIIDFNPNKVFWAHEEVIPRDDADFIILTFKDNEFLSEEERNEILSYKIKGETSKWWLNKWQIYGLGIPGIVENRIFFFEEVKDDFYHKLDVPIYYGVDWGAVDPMGILEAKYYDGALYLHELNYRSENSIRENLTSTERIQIEGTEEGLVMWLFKKLNIDYNRPIVCDNNRPLKIIALRKAGFEYAIAAKKAPGSIIDGIDLLSSMKVYYTASSKNIKYEQENYCRGVDRYGIVLEEPNDLNNHLMDPARYIAEFLRQQGIINNI